MAFFLLLEENSCLPCHSKFLCSFLCRHADTSHSSPHSQVHVFSPANRDLILFIRITKIYLFFGCRTAHKINPPIVAIEKIGPASHKLIQPPKMEELIKPARSVRIKAMISIRLPPIKVYFDTDRCLHPINSDLSICCHFIIPAGAFQDMAGFPALRGVGRPHDKGGAIPHCAGGQSVVYFPHQTHRRDSLCRTAGKA